ncbi:hypothetical protein CAPTEDRAFT_227198 [Capitella teleta]|uniref:Uncharacterized protein n=1 Tax=Capitella teleta TaxID=283909 RepID=R7TYQ8_CAPTE|nr:hypothetical protein CAPTEDRAFT_227198 [Capitella teleta]|eukprot:ELT96561.1 hypothetical protein CAPTEDRAFT_227198 [Capitella teleta]
MSDADDPGALVEQLQEEISRLQHDLETTTQERLQAAEYGLAVLEEKQVLQNQYDEMEAILETTKHELDLAKEALSVTHKTQKKANEVGIHAEESLLFESATREATLMENITELENEFKSSKQSLERLTTENDRLNNMVIEVGNQNEQLEGARKQMKKEIKELKFRETRNMADYSELEEENIMLQKQLLQLKQAQVDYEATKHELKRYKEEVEYLQAEVEELAKLKMIVEKNLEESLQSLQQEREQKHALKKELDQRITSESMFNLHSLASLGFGDLKASDGKINFDQHNEDQDSNDNPALKRIEADFSSSGKEPAKPAPAPKQDLVGDLFSEIHLTEMRKLEHVLEQTEIEKSRLQQALEESQGSLSSAEKEISEQQEKITQMKAHLAAMALLTTNGEEEVLDGNEDSPEVNLMRKNLKQQEQKYSAAMEQIQQLQEEVQALKVTLKSHEKDDGDDVKDELTKLRNKVLEYEESTRNLDSDLQAMSQLVGESQGNISSTQEDLVKVSEDLMTLYHLVCEVNGETPNRSPEKEMPEARGDPITCYKMLETIHDQMKYLRRAVERSVEISRQRQMGNNTSEEVVELQEQVVKLKAMLSTKREQIATLRSVLKANKATAEMALGNLKGKYENEKGIVTETMQKLRNELKGLKEDAATFASLRAMFAQRCDEYVTQLDELQRQLSAAEEEKKTLNSLLRMAIQQKLALTQRLEDLEFDRERRNMRRPGPRGKGPTPKLTTSGEFEGAGGTNGL